MYKINGLLKVENEYSNIMKESLKLNRLKKCNEYESGSKIYSQLKTVRYFIN
jgi:hypothetical protein